MFGSAGELETLELVSFLVQASLNRGEGLFETEVAILCARSGVRGLFLPPLSRCIRRRQTGLSTPVLLI